jgi:phage terminase small subunit
VRGAKPKPTHLKLVQGNPGKRSLNKAEAKPALSLPTPPTELNDDAKVECGSVSDELYRVGPLSKIDRASLAAYCQAYGRWMQAERALTRMANNDPVFNGFDDKDIEGQPRSESACRQPKTYLSALSESAYTYKFPSTFMAAVFGSP